MKNLTSKKKKLTPWAYYKMARWEIFEKEFVSRDKGGVPEWNIRYKDKSPSFIILSIKKFLGGYESDRR